MRITFISGALPPMKCGIGDFASVLASELAALGHAVTAVTSRPAAAGPHGVTVRAIMPGWGPTAFRTLLAAVSRTAPDVINLHVPSQEYGRFSAVDLFALLRRRDRPLVTTIHEFLTFQRLGRLRIGLLAHASRRVIVPEAGNLAALAARWPRLAARLELIPLGPTLTPPAVVDRHTVRDRLGMSAGHFHLAYTGFLSPGKGVETLLAAVERLPEDLPTTLWLLAGQEPAHPNYAAYHRAIAARVGRISRPETVRWTGFLPANELSDHLLAADLIVLPYDDGATLRRTTLLNALAHGRPVLSTGARPPAPGVMVVPPRDPAAMSVGLAGLLRDEDGLRVLTEAAAQAAAGFSWPTIAGRTAAAFGAAAGTAQVSP